MFRFYYDFQINQKFDATYNYIIVYYMYSINLLFSLDVTQSGSMIDKIYL